MDSPGIEPGAFCMQNRRDTTTPQTLSKLKQIPIQILQLKLLDFS